MFGFESAFGRSPLLNRGWSWAIIVGYLSRKPAPGPISTKGNAMYSDAPLSTELEIAIDQVLRRSVIDEDLRTLAVASPGAALAKFNPKLLKEDRIRFVETSESTRDDSTAFDVVLPNAAWAELQLSDAELEEFVGADCTQTCVTDSCAYTCPCTSCCFTC